MVDGKLQKRRMGDEVPAEDGKADLPNDVRLYGEVLQPSRSGVGSSTIKRYAATSSVERALEDGGGIPSTVRGSDNQERSMEQPPEIKTLRSIRGALGDLHQGPSKGLEKSLYSLADKPYETDLFGNPLPGTGRRTERERPYIAGFCRCLQPAFGLHQ